MLGGLKKEKSSSNIITQRSLSKSMRKNLVLGNTRELNRELYTRLSTLYTKTPWSMLLYF